jgi:hypothetical protein
MLSEYEACVCRDHRAGHEPSSASNLKVVLVLTIVLGLGWVFTAGSDEAGSSETPQVQRQI